MRQRRNLNLNSKKKNISSSGIALISTLMMTPFSQGKGLFLRIKDKASLIACVVTTNSRPSKTSSIGKCVLPS
jgi:hypothetical protein